MPFPVLAFVTGLATAVSTRNEIRNSQIVQNQQRRAAEQARKELEQIHAQERAKRQSNAEMDKRLPFQISLPSKPANSYALEKSPFPDVTVGGQTFNTGIFVIGAMGVLLLLLVKRSL